MIGIFDSGIGGITVVKEIKRALPKSSILYFGDTERLPYGNRSPETIRKYAREDIEFLISKGAKVIVAACNSASTVIDDDFRSEFDVPIFEVITPAVEAAIRATKNHRIGLIGTRATVGSKIYKVRIEKFCNKQADLENNIDCVNKVNKVNMVNMVNKKVNRTGMAGKVELFSQACPLFVSLVEENWIKKFETKMIVKKYLYSLKMKNIDTLILGCTHYPLLKDVIARVMRKNVKLIDCAEQVAESLISTNLATNMRESRIDGIDRYFVSDLTPHFQDLAERWLGKNIKLEKV